MDARSELHHYNPYRVFSRTEWANLRQDTPMTLDEAEISALSSMRCNRPVAPSSTSRP